MGHARPTFYVWDSEGSPPKGDLIPVLWRGFGDGGAGRRFSIPMLVEEQADKLRARLLGWLHDLGEAQIDGKRLVDRFALRPGFSYWWMTLLAEKSYGKSPGLVDAVKLLALEDLIGAHSAGKLILASGDKRLARAVRLLCRNAGVGFKWQRLDVASARESFTRSIYRMLPHPAQALVFLLRYIMQRWSLRQVASAFSGMSAGEITFFSYLDNLDIGAARQGIFSSRYWTVLSDVLAEENIGANWCQLFVKDETVPTAQQALDFTASFNRTGADRQIHFTLDTALGLRVIVGALCDYGRIVLAGSFSRQAARHRFRPEGSQVDLWALFEQDWNSSIYGTTAAANCLFLNLFEKTLKRMPRQRLGVYLMENQAWERALIHAWRSTGHGNLIGYQHTTVSHWDLRHFFDPRNYRRTGMNDLPLPDSVALNGPAAIAAYRQGSFPEERIVETEALRYLYLADLPHARSNPIVDIQAVRRVLVLGDYRPSVTRHQMQMLAAAALMLPSDTRYIVKPHPNCSVKPIDYPSLKMQITALPLADLLGDCDVAYTSNSTAAAVDAYCAGVPVVSVLDGDAFNISPLRGLAEARFVTCPLELANELRRQDFVDSEAERKVYFTIDKALPRWRSLLDSTGL